MTEFEKNDPLVQKIWDRLRTLLGAKVRKINSEKDMEKVAKRYKSLSGYEKSGLLKKSNVYKVIKEKKMQTFVKGYKDSKGRVHKGYYKQTNIPWTKKDRQNLAKYKSKGRTLAQMSYYLNRTPSSIKAKLKAI